MSLRNQNNAPKKTVVIISAEDYRRNTTYNKDQTDALERTLSYEGYTYKRALGMYRGVSEKSFVVTLPDFNDVYSLRALAKDFNQESILVRDTDGVYLFYSNGHQEKIGKELSLVPKQLAIKKDAYTTIGDNHYIVK